MYWCWGMAMGPYRYTVIIVNHADQSIIRITHLNEFGRYEMNDCNELEPKVPDFHILLSTISELCK